MRPGAAALPLSAVLIVGAAGTAIADRPDFAVTVGVPNQSFDGWRHNGVIDNRPGSGSGAQVLSEPDLGRAGPGRAPCTRPAPYLARLRSGSGQWQSTG